MPDTVSAMAAAKLEKERALAKLRQLQSAALEAKLLNAAEVLSTWSAAMAGLRDRALGMGGLDRKPRRHAAGG